MVDLANEAAEDAVEDGAEGEAPAKGGKRKLLLVGGLAFALVAGGAATMYVLDPFGLFEAAPMTANGEPPPPKPVFYELPEITVNLVAPGKRTTFLKLDVVLEVSNRAMVNRIRPYMPRVLDAFQVYLRELRVADIEGSAGLFRLKEELQRRINTAIYPAKIEGVLFRNILVQ